MNFVDDIRALKFVRHFHRKRILRFQNKRQFKQIEDVNDLARSKIIMSNLNKILGSK